MGSFGLVSVCLLVVTIALFTGVSSKRMYKFQHEKTTWAHAEELCKIWGGHLATISTKEENVILRHQMEIRNIEEVWIGLNDRHGEGAFEWSSKPTNQFMNWMKGEPNGNRGENCVEMLVVNRYWKNWNGEWLDQSCEQSRPFVCEKKRGYWYHTGKSTWANAKSTCHAWGGHLVIIESRAENNRIASGLKKRGMEGSWIGLNDKNHEGMYDWADKHRYLKYENFNNNEPNGRRGENCVEMIRGWHWWTQFNGQWIDRNCNTKLRSICEKRAGK